MTATTKPAWRAPRLRQLGTLGDVAAAPRRGPGQNRATQNPQS